MGGGGNEPKRDPTTQHEDDDGKKKEGIMRTNEVMMVGWVDTRRHASPSVENPPAQPSVGGSWGRRRWPTAACLLTGERCWLFATAGGGSSGQSRSEMDGGVDLNQAVTAHVTGCTGSAVRQPMRLSETACRLQRKQGPDQASIPARRPRGNE